ncbi:MAG: hypothetical protein H6830_01625 [Planctomycetes bacterium]|nr:hypothetical protein [Planctomycetota bacterium]MCB9910342.1 hypothetical protein [Planctomycetota bacterium]MCB9912047.1 hypothetical protein [Planctomycetota bacterium]
MLCTLLLPFFLSASASASTFPSVRTPLQAPSGVQAPAPLPRGDREGFEDRSDFFPGAQHDPAITTPDAILGQPVGSRLARHEEIVLAFTTWAAESPRIVVGNHGQTYEGRELLHAIITSPANQARLAAIQADNARLADPRQVRSGELEGLIHSTPAVAWLGYSIHGDETSGADAALAVAYHLVACTDADVTGLLEDVVIVLAPEMNPDGRARIVSLVEQNSGQRVNLDYASMARGRWPFGRGNHYLFDMNRDWMAGVAPETRGRWSLLRQWTPQLFVDAHEMSGLDTFLMYPQAPPRHPALPKRLLYWQGIFADAHGEAFDRMGWGYYTREWADAWYPGYSDAWGSLNGAIGMLYEQGRNAGQPIQREGGEVVPYREAVHGQVVASLSNLATLRANREALRRDAFEHRLTQMQPAEGKDRVILFEATRLGSRLEPMLQALLDQGMEVARLGQDQVAKDVVSSLGEASPERSFPAGTYAVRLAQPQGALVRSYLEFDPRIDAETLADERGRLERGEASRLYDVTAWDLSRQFDVAAYWGTLALGDDAKPWLGMEPTRGSVLDRRGRTDPPYGYVVDGADDRSLAFAGRAMELGLVVHLADEPFAPDLGVEPREVFPRGSLLLRRHENPGGEAALGGAPATADWNQLVAQAASETGVQVHAVRGGRAADLERADLGGGHFVLLARPKIALLSGPPLSQTDFGDAWQYLDEVLRLPVSLLAAESLPGTDLRRYNVLVVPSGDVGTLLHSEWPALQAWVRSGGTLIAIDAAAQALADGELGLGDVRLRRDVLEDLEPYGEAARRQREAGTQELDLAQVWGDVPATAPTAAGEALDQEATEPEVEEASDDDAASEHPLAHLDSDLQRADRLARRFMPVGAILRAEVDDRSWLTIGTNGELPVPYAGSAVLLSSGEVPVRLAARDRLRLGGLVWPEARVRLENGAWLAREGLGYGQVIFFAQDPTYRGSWRGTARLLGNAVVLGPGMGAHQPSGW